MITELVNQKGKKYLRLLIPAHPPFLHFLFSKLKTKIRGFHYRAVRLSDKFAESSLEATCKTTNKLVHSCKLQFSHL
jgi:hypothetical protein